MVNHSYIFYTLSIIYLLIFLKGYFPVNEKEYTDIPPPNVIHDRLINVNEVYKPQIDRLVLIVIDALRTDFLTEDKMPYTFANNECMMNVKVEVPTVTLPRIKALTSGEIPQYIDLLFNLGAHKSHDSFLHKMKKIGRRMVFYGDNTWLKMFPDMFDRHDGTTSFFVNDFYEVDDNVTRHLDVELNQSDWDVLILHYLGLDHIGHVYGPYSKLIAPKLNEMDLIIKRIVTQLEKSSNPTRNLIIVTGDHGMKNSGGHGGSTYAETHVPITFFGAKCDRYQSLIAQSDIATTLSVLFAIEIPSQTVGRLIDPILNSNIDLNYLYALYYNIRVLKKESNMCEQDFKNAQILHQQIFDKFDVQIGKIVSKLYNKCLDEISEALIQRSVEQNVYLLTFALINTINTLLCIVASSIGNNKVDLMLILTSLVLILFTRYLLIGNFLGVLLLMRNLLRCKFTFKSNNYFTSFFLIIHLILMQSSSFVEEEHQIFYYFLTASSLLIYYHSKFKQFFVLGIICGLRLLRMINNTGDQYGSYPDFADWLILDENSIYLILFHLISLVILYSAFSYLIKLTWFDHFVAVTTFALIFMFKTFFMKSVILPRIVWLLTSLLAFKNRSIIDKFILTWILLVTLLLKPYNLILVPSCIIASNIYNKFVKDVTFLTIIHVYLGFTLFFCQGHSNAISSVDLASAYYGLTEYVPFLVVLFTLIHTYAFPVLSTLLLLRNDENLFDSMFYTKIIVRLSFLIVVYIQMIFQRGHLFVWSVFAPKLIIESMHSVILLFEMILMLILRSLRTKFC